LCPYTTLLNNIDITPGKPQKTYISDLIELWHRYLVYLNPLAMKILLVAMVQYSNNHNISLYNICIHAKHHVIFDRIQVPSSSIPFEFIYSDLCGPIKHPSLSGAAYYIIYVDNYTKYTKLYFLVGKLANEIMLKFNYYYA
jgi:hypothetical protein